MQTAQHSASETSCNKIHINFGIKNKKNINELGYKTLEGQPLWSNDSISV